MKNRSYRRIRQDVYDEMYGDTKSVKVKFRLSLAASKDFIRTLMNPPLPGSRLMQAAERYMRTLTLDELAKEAQDMGLYH